MLELGIGTGETARRVLALHPRAELIGIDESPGMLAAAAPRLVSADLRVGRLEEPLPDGRFDLVVSALVVHHLDAPGKVDLFARIAELLRHGGRFVLGDVVVPEDPADAVTPNDGVYDKRAPSPISSVGSAPPACTREWCGRAKTLAVIVAERAG